jgi:hypothetical protein
MSVFLQRLLDRGCRTVGQICSGRDQTASLPAGAPTHSEERLDIAVPQDAVPGVHGTIAGHQARVEPPGSGAAAPRSTRATADGPDSADPRHLAPIAELRPAGLPQASHHDTGIDQAEAPDMSAPRIAVAPPERRPPAQPVSPVDASARWRELQARLLVTHPPPSRLERREEERSQPPATTDPTVDPEGHRLPPPPPPARPRAGAAAGTARPVTAVHAGPSPLTVRRTGDPAGEAPPEVVIEKLEVRIVSGAAKPSPSRGRARAQDPPRGAWTIAARRYLGRL